MAMDGVDVGAWLALGFEEVSQEQQPSSACAQEHTGPPVDARKGTSGSAPLCYTCLDEDRETVANSEYNGVMYCSKHLPAHRQLSQDEIVERFRQEVARFFNGCTVHYDPPDCLSSFPHIKWQKHLQGFGPDY